MGFAIGASSLRPHWAPHELLCGILSGLFLGISYGDRRFPSNLLFLKKRKDTLLLKKKFFW